MYVWDNGFQTDREREGTSPPGLNPITQHICYSNIDKRPLWPAVDLRPSRVPYFPVPLVHGRFSFKLCRCVSTCARLMDPGIRIRSRALYKIRKLQKPLYEPANWVVLCVHENRIPCLEWYEKEAFIEQHQPVKVSPDLFLGVHMFNFVVHSSFMGSGSTRRDTRHIGQF